jgi:hypothetical protein
MNRQNLLQLLNCPAVSWVLIGQNLFAKLLQKIIGLEKCQEFLS